MFIGFVDAFIAFGERIAKLHSCSKYQKLLRWWSFT